jgi:hypothetical protein
LLGAGCVPNEPPPTGVVPHPAPDRVAQWSEFEAGLDVTPAPSNPFDPHLIDVRATFVDPAGGAHDALGFWYQGYTRSLVNGRERLDPVGAPYFAVRFTPTTPGKWHWSWSVRTPGHVITTPTTTLRVDKHAAHGFVRRSTRDARYLAFDDGTPYFAVGENVGWYDARGTYDYDSWFDQLAQQHANFARLWMPSWAFGIEWSDTGLGDYTARLPRAWQLDEVFDAAAARGIYVELSLLNHGAFSTAFNSEWAANPYNAANGGPIASPKQFFTDPVARRYLEQRLRYVVARWGASTHLLAWELWNEVDLTDGYDSAAVTAWHSAMAGELRDLDPNDHLVSTSHAVFANDPQVWAGGGLDFTQVHFYQNPIGWFPDLSKDVVTFTGDRVAATNKPVLFAELGINSDGAAQTRADDPDGIGVHDGLFAGVVSQGFGTAMTWWWDNLIDVEPDRYYPMFGAAARFVHDVAWDRESFVPVTATASTATARPVVAYGLRGTKSALVWVKDDAAQPGAAAPVTIGDAALDVGALSAHAWCGRWYDTWSGNWIARVRVPAGATTVSVPSFARDVALRLRAC